MKIIGEKDTGQPEESKNKDKKQGTRYQVQEKILDGNFESGTCISWHLLLRRTLVL